MMLTPYEVSESIKELYQVSDDLYKYFGFSDMMKHPEVNDDLERYADIIAQLACQLQQHIEQLENSLK